MNGKIVRILAVALSVMLLSGVFVGCKPKDQPIDSDFGTYEWEYGKETVSDSSKLTAWDQSNYEITAWNANGTGGFNKLTSDNDVVSAEIKRVTGVSINTRNSFDNAGSRIEAALEKVIMMREKPQIAYGTAEMSTIIAENKRSGGKLLYDLTDYIDEYCPTIKARMPASVWNSASVNGGEAGKVYGIPYNLGDVGLSVVDPTADKKSTVAFEYMQNYYNCVYVREDILLGLYPNAHSYSDLQDIYSERGEFTTEEIYDVSIKSKQEFYDFLYAIADYINDDIAKNGSASRYSLPQGRKVMPILACDGSDRDNWSWGAGLIPMLIGANGYLNTMFAYWDAIDKQVKNMLLQPFYEEILNEWKAFIAEGKICNDYGFRTPFSVVQQEMNKGYYAVAYPNCTPPDSAARLDNNYSGETVKYRKVWIQVDLAPQFEFFAQGAPVASSIVIFKDSVSENRLPQILRWLDYQCSTLADKLYGWGPETAGLYTEDENGVRQFKDETLANQMVYETSVMGDLVQKYNLSNQTIESAQPIFSFFRNGGSKYHPKCFYDLSQMPAMMDAFFSPAVADPKNDEKMVNIYRRADIHYNTDWSGVSTLWDKRSTIESAVTNVLLGKGTYQQLKDTCTMSLWSDEYFGDEYTQKFLATNADYLVNFKKGATK